MGCVAHYDSGLEATKTVAVAGLVVVGGLVAPEVVGAAATVVMLGTAIVRIRLGALRIRATGGYW